MWGWPISAVTRGKSAKIRVLRTSSCTCELQITCSDTLSRNYRRLVGARFRSRITGRTQARLRSFPSLSKSASEKKHITSSTLFPLGRFGQVILNIDLQIHTINTSVLHNPIVTWSSV